MPASGGLKPAVMGRWWCGGRALPTTQTPPASLAPLVSGPPPPPPATGDAPGDAVLSPIALCRVIVCAAPPPPNPLVAADCFVLR